MTDTVRSILAGARGQLWMLASSERSADAVVEFGLDVVRVALTKQRRMIARAINAEARRAALGQYPGGCRSITYDAGMRRAARVAKAAGDAS